MKKFMTRRRLFLGVLCALAIGSAIAQRRPARIGILSGVARDQSPSTLALLKALAELGYPEGRQLSVEFRSTDGAPERAAALARELVASNCDVIFALPAEPLARALRDLRTAVPVVFLAFEYDPVERGIVQRLSRPEGNLTGVYAPVAALTAKQLEMAQEVLPRAKRFLVFTDDGSRHQLEVLSKAAAGRAELTVVEYSQRPYDFAAGFEAGRRAKVDAAIGLWAAEFNVRRAELAALYSRYRLPAFVPGFMASEPGILISYGPDFEKVYRRAAEVAVKILNGTKPGEIPVEQPDEFDLVVNLRTAKTLGLKIPYSLLTRATKIIE